MSDAASNDRTRRGYDLWSATYDKLDNPLIAMSRVAMQRWLRTLDGKDVIELGCGTGRNAATILAAGARSYVGVDASAGMLDVARARRLDGRARFVPADLTTALPVDAADAMLICLVLEHFEQLDAVLRNAVDRLRPNGCLQCYELHADLRRAGTAAHFLVDATVHTLPSFAHDADELTRVLTGLGCVIETARDWIATPETVAESEKLQRHVGRAVLLEVAARRIS